MVLSTKICVENGTCASLLVSYKPLFHTTIPYILTYKTLKRAAMLKKKEKDQI